MSIRSWKPPAPEGLKVSYGNVAHPVGSNRAYSSGAAMLKSLLPALALCLAGPVSLAAGDDLPDIGSPSDAVLTGDQEGQLGRMVLRQIRAAGVLVEDPAVVEYIQDLGAQLATHAHDGDHDFYFFVVDDPQINAFALPGGYIGVNSGLIQATENESELAGVMAHEIAHVTQRHIARAIADNQRTSMMSAAAMLAAILVGVTTNAGGEAIQAGVAASQAASIQRQINFTRSNEYEADRVGISILSAAGFDPYGMPAFFSTLARRYGMASRRIPQLLQTHPVTTDRIAESRGRARLLPPGQATNSSNYGLVRARLQLDNARTTEDARAYFEERLEQNPDSMENQYGLGLTLMRMSLADQAEVIFRDLLESNPGVIALHIAQAEALMAGDRQAAALDVYGNAVGLFPRNVPLIISYAEALIAAGQAREAHDMLLDLLNNVRPTPPQVRLIARAANAAGDIGNAHYYMCEYHLMLGSLPLAMDQLRMALEAPGVNAVDQARYQARLADLAAVAPKNNKRKEEEETNEGS